MPMPEEGSSGIPEGVIPVTVPTRTGCFFCGLPVDLDNPDNYRQVVSWVNGPKLDHPVMRDRTGEVAHKRCIDKQKVGQAPDQPEMEF